MIHCNLNNKDFSLAKNIVQTTEAINQIKLMHKPESTQEILTVVDNSGEIVVLTLDIIKDEKIRTKMNKYELIKTKKYSAKIDFHDNSPWSVDCKYPYIIIGSNNRTVFVYNYEEDNIINNNINENNENNENNNLIKNAVIYKGNNNNIPCVTISEDGNFIGNNSIDRNFKIFDFHTGELILSEKNPRNEWGWGMKFIPRNLFKTKNKEIEIEELRKENNLVNPALSAYKITELNVDNPSKYDENDVDKIPYEDLNDYEKYIKLNLIDKYYILTSCNHCAGLFRLDYKKEENSDKKKLVGIPLGKIELTRIYIRDLYMGTFNLDYGIMYNINGIYQSSRYEFAFYSKNMNLILLGSKSGDLHVFEMNLIYDKEKKLIGIEDEPNALISFGSKVAGMKFIENENDKGRKVIDVFAITLSGIFYYYKIYPDNNFWECHFDE